MTIFNFINVENYEDKGSCLFKNCERERFSGTIQV